MIADDDPDILDLLEAYFTGRGHEITAVVNGKDALQKAEAGAFDLILLDVMMPYIDGYHVAQEITEKFGAKAPKIIIMTSRDVAAEKGIVMLSGAAAAVQKPFTLEELDRRIAEVLGC